MRLLLPLLLALCAYAQDSVEEQFAKRAARLWSLQPVIEPSVPSGITSSKNPIDAFIAAEYKAKGLAPAGKADKLTLLRRVYFDLIGIPPTIAEQDAFLADQSPDAYEKVVDRLLADEQHGVRWSRHWLDVLRYADLDGLDGSVMPASNGIYLWRDWVIRALNDDVPYDQFVRAQILGNRYPPKTVTNDFGHRSRVEGSVEDTFALGPRPLRRDARRQGFRRCHGRRRNHFHRVHGHDGGLREMPRSQVRSHHPKRFLRHEGDFRPAGAEERHAGDAEGNF
jgi:hypothetical protein